MKLKIILPSIIFVMTLSEMKAAEVENKQLDQNLSGKIVNHQQINDGNSNKIRKLVESEIEWPFKTITINERVEISVPIDFELKKEDKNSLEQIDFYDKSEERIKKVVSYILEERVCEIGKKNPELSSLYLITSIWAGNDSEDVWDNLYDKDKDIIHDLRESSPSSSKENIKNLVSRMKRFW